MKTYLKIAVVLGALALATAPAMALAAPSTGGQGHGNGNDSQYAPETPGPKDPLPEQAKAYGVYCKDESRRHVKGEKGTPFSRCVKAMARAARSEKLTARQACKSLSKEHVKGEKGTPFSRCVSAAAKLRSDQQA